MANNSKIQMKRTLNPYLIFPVIACLSLMACKKEGAAGKNSLITQLPEAPGIHCAAGGYKVISGVDENSNNQLDSNEIQQTNYVCNGNGNYDKETIFQFAEFGYYTSSAQGIIHKDLGIDNFNITNYVADSASFSCYLYTTDVNVKSMVELYDITNNKVINNTLLTSNSLTYELKTTTLNFIDQFPKSPIKLGCRIRSETDGKTIVVSKIVLKLYRK
jgi:hypothetical protein